MSTIDRYSINPLGVLFHPELDQKNHYQTIVFNPKTEQILRINQYGYDILKVIDEKPGSILDDICNYVAQRRDLEQYINKEKVFKLIQEMIRENVVFAK